jgi:hypothetical protein
MRNGTSFYLLDLIDRSWTMGLNFGCTMLSQPNLIKIKERTISSPYPHQILPIRYNLLWETGDPKES